MWKQGTEDPLWLQGVRFGAEGAFASASQVAAFARTCGLTLSGAPKRKAALLGLRAAGVWLPIRTIADDTGRTTPPLPNHPCAHPLGGPVLFRPFFRPPFFEPPKYFGFPVFNYSWRGGGIGVYIYRLYTTHYRLPPFPKLCPCPPGPKRPEALFRPQRPNRHPYVPMSQQVTSL